MTKEFIEKWGHPVLRVQIEPGEQLCLTRKTKYGDELVYCACNEKLFFEFDYNVEKTKAFSLAISTKFEACGTVCNFDDWYVDSTKKWGEE